MSEIIAPGEGRMAPPTSKKKKPLSPRQAFQPVPLTPKPQPDPVLSKHGVFDPPDSVVVKVKAIKAAHDAKFGRPATPGHVYDVIRSGVPVEDIPRLYDAVPRNRKAARLARVPSPSPDTQDVAVGIDLGEGFDPMSRMWSDAWQASYSNEFDKWFNENQDTFKTLSRKDRERIAVAKNRGELWRARDMEGNALQAVRRGHIIPASPENIQLVMKSGVDPVSAFGPSWDAFNNIITAVALGPPVLALGEAKAVAETVKNPETILGQEQTPFTKFNAEAIKEIGKGFYRDVRYPKENFEYLLLDAFGFSSLLAGGAARAGTAARASGGLKGKAKALVQRRGPGTRKVVFGDPDNPFGQLAVDVLNSENTLIREAPVVGQKARTARANVRRENAPPLDPALAQKESSLSRWKKRHVSQESAARGRLASDIRIDQASRSMAVNDLRQMSSTMTKYQFIRDNLPERVRGRLSRGEDAVLRVLAVDEPGGFPAQIALLRDFHQRQIVLGLGDAADHFAKLDNLDMAEQAYKKPGKTLLAALDAVPGAIKEREAILRDFGMSEQTQARRVAQEAEVLRGKPTTKQAALSEIYFLKQSLNDPPVPYVDKAKVADRIEEIRGMFADLPSSITRERQRLDALSEQRNQILTAASEADIPRAYRSFDADVQAQINKLQGLLSAKHTERRGAVEKYSDASVRAKIAQLQQVQSATGKTLEQRRADALVQIDKRIQKHVDEINRSQTILDEIEPLSDQSFYFPLRSESHKPVKSTVSSRGTRKTDAGIAPRNPQRDLRMKYQFEGDTLRLGDYRMDTSNLVADEVARAHNVLGLFNEYKNLLAASTDVQKFSSQVPIRTPESLGKISPQLREILTREPGAVILSDEAKALVGRNWHDFVKDAFGGATYNETLGRWKFPTKAEKGDFRWVDSTLINADAYLPPVPSSVIKGAQGFNSAVRFLILYPRLAYLTNLIGSAGMQLWYQNVFAIPHVYNAIRAEKVYGKAFNDFAKEQLGGGRYVANAETTNLLGRWGNVERKVAYGLNKITDEKLRVSALINRLRQAGFSNKEFNDLAKGHRDGTLEPGVRSKVDTAILRAKKDSVEWDNLTFFEKQYLRQLIFIYPWQSRSAVWNMRAILERPTQSAAMAQIGRDALEDWEAEGGGDVEEWMSKRGFVPWFWDDDGNPVGTFTGGVNSLGSIHSLISGVDRKDYWRSLGGPMAQVGIGTVTGTDEFGRDYKRNGALWNFYSAVVEQVTGLPQVSATQKLLGAEKASTKTIDIKDRKTLVERLNKTLEEVALSPGWSFKLAGIPIAGTLVTGGALTKRELNAARVKAAAYDALPEEKKRIIQRDLYNKALGMQAEALKGDASAVPELVRDAVNLQFDMDAYVADKIKANPDNHNKLQEIGWSLEFLVQKGVLTESQAKSKAAEVKREAPSERDRDRTIGPLIDPTGALEKWDADVTRLAVASSQKDLPYYLTRLREQNLGSYSDITGMRIDDLRAYGKTVAEYYRKADDLAEQAQDKSLSPGVRMSAAYELNRLEDEFDQDVQIGGRKLPSPVRLNWSLDTDQERQKKAFGDVKAGWGTLSSFDKEVLGRNPGKNINTAWVEYNLAVDDYAARHGGSSPMWAKDHYAKLAGKKYPGFYEDYLFSKRPIAERLEYLKPVQESANKQAWSEVIGLAKRQLAQIKAGSPAGATRNRWKTQIAPAIVQLIQEDPAYDDFNEELKRVGYDIIDRMLDN